MHQRLLFLSMVVWVWLGMMLLHELGHILAVWWTGGEIERVVVPLIGFSQTIILHNPSPLITAWAGPLVGMLLPLVAWLGAAAVRSPAWLTALLRFFAGFCLIANGLYLGLGWIGNVGDAGDLLRHGSAMWHLLLFAILAVPAGLRLWHRLGPAFGIGAAGESVQPIMAYTSLGLAMMTVVVALAIGQA